MHGYDESKLAGTELRVAIAELEQHLRLRGYAASTIAVYGQYLGYFVRHLDGQHITDLRQVTHQSILDYQAEVAALPLASESRALRMRPIKRLFELLVQSHRLLLDPTEGIVQMGRQRRRVMPVLTLGEMERLLAQPDLSVPSQMRDRAIMEVFYSTAIRSRELLQLELCDVDLRGGVLFVRHGKGGRQRVVPLGSQAGRYLAEYLTGIRPQQVEKGSQQQRVFLTMGGRPLSKETVAAFLRGYRLRAGIDKRVSPHTLRRTCATHLLQQGADIRHIQKLLGHVSLRTTQSYTRLMPVDLKQTHSRTHPGRKLGQQLRQPDQQERKLHQQGGKPDQQERRLDQEETQV